MKHLITEEQAIEDALKQDIMDEQRRVLIEKDDMNEVRMTLATLGYAGSAELGYAKDEESGNYR